MYKRPLKVSTAKGVRVYATVVRVKDTVRISVDYFAEVERDAPEFAKNGRICMVVHVDKYPKTIELITQYLEDLFLKGMADEDIRSSLGAQLDSRRTSKRSSRGKAKESEGGSTTSVHARSRGSKSSESSRGRKPTSEMAESGDSKNSGKD